VELAPFAVVFFRFFPLHCSRFSWFHSATIINPRAGEVLPLLAHGVGVGDIGETDAADHGDIGIVSYSICITACAIV
jgi:hypothetical protein